jgi:hypothetical protein
MLQAARFIDASHSTFNHVMGNQAVSYNAAIAVATCFSIVLATICGLILIAFATICGLVLIAFATVCGCIYQTYK